jgi:hypothetical protein
MLSAVYNSIAADMMHRGYITLSEWARADSGNIVEGSDFVLRAYNRYQYDNRTFIHNPNLAKWGIEDTR